MADKHMELTQIKKALLRAKLDYTEKIAELTDLVNRISGAGICPIEAVLSHTNWAHASSENNVSTQTVTDPELLTGKQWLYLICGDEAYTAAGIEALDIDTDEQIVFRCPSASTPGADVTVFIIRLEVT